MHKPLFPNPFHLGLEVLKRLKPEEGFFRPHKDIQKIAATDAGLRLYIRQVSVVFTLSLSEG